MSEAAIERSDGVLVEALLEAGLTVVVITSRQMKNLALPVRVSWRQGRPVRRVRRRPTCCARTVPGCARSWSDTPATAALRAVVRARP